MEAGGTARRWGAGYIINGCLIGRMRCWEFRTRFTPGGMWAARLRMERTNRFAHALKRHLGTDQRQVGSMFGLGDNKLSLLVVDICTSVTIGLFEVNKQNTEDQFDFAFGLVNYAFV